MAFSTCRISRLLLSMNCRWASPLTLSMTTMATAMTGTDAMVRKAHVSFCLIFMETNLLQGPSRASIETLTDP